MLRFQIDVRTEDYQRYVIEEPNEEEAREAAEIAFRIFLSDNPVVDIDVDEVPGDTPLGDN